jgi:hypothetical protein
MNYPGRLIRRGESDESIVRAVQQRLNALSIGVPDDDFTFVPLKVDGDFGINTEKAVKLFQLNFTDSDGQPLRVDGVIGAATWASLFGNETVPEATDAGLSPFLRQVLSVAASQVGVRENPVGSNRGPEVDRYLRTVGLNPAGGSFAWCVAFLYWCFEQASQQDNLPDNPMFRTAGVHVLWHRSRDQARVRRITPQQAAANFSLVQPGQIFCLDHGSGQGHMGIVESIHQGKMVTIEGNTNVGGSREGIGVFRRTSRHIEEVDLGFIDYSRV